ncbi:MAG: phenylalanine--tRNA ligase subunit alpha [Elusimicrobia bacterium CG1_02_63_36]|nr:MAG: phenylalanine--tRNA ligase subunit alpha [Elusimicrobia bacterium CG1_02_63_36]PIP82819.1 MAG: phenylalanine--tRNA ligase subunit alpha [Elusimicrobia bacterium CG22_combo_CG10-13_8_21_14_all_63_91]PJA16125.1 MAG: phenylalanine--tRNA ligase subunit alpha [Elusimicrobia bacterium CG_4_10_14_0_2_um_filter_63_34]PJB26203.1 MAG: phenylalanine--tRNA ligase subunit alpha [Elusimicrobia bacterium CG_4_9_14_3_um_filter_62_55]
MTRESWEQRLRGLEDSAVASVSGATDLESLEAVRVDLLGRKGRLTGLLKGLKDLTIDDRKTLGPQANRLRDEVARLIEDRRTSLERAAIDAELASVSLDASLPPRDLGLGRRHPITKTIEDMAGILSRLGFAWADGPRVESDRYNFTALNIPEDHSARDMQDTFYLENGQLLRTHTSPVQIRYLEKHAPPVRIMAPGRVFRHEAEDAGHAAVFHQIEGLYVDRGVTMADLKNTLSVFMKGLFGAQTKIRMRPSYFPFTEPSAEVDVQCLLCKGDGCSACKQSGWMEMLGSGVVNPAVLKGVGLDTEIWSGFAFGVGVERIAMLRLGIPDIRMFYENDLRFLRQVGA